MRRTNRLVGLTVLALAMVTPEVVTGARAETPSGVCAERGDCGVETYERLSDTEALCECRGTAGKVDTCEDCRGPVRALLLEGAARPASEDSGSDPSRCVLVVIGYDVRRVCLLSGMIHDGGDPVANAVIEDPSPVGHRHWPMQVSVDNAAAAVAANPALAYQTRLRLDPETGELLDMDASPCFDGRSIEEIEIATTQWVMAGCHGPAEVEVEPYDHETITMVEQGRLTEVPYDYDEELLIEGSACYDNQTECARAIETACAAHGGVTSNSRRRPRIAMCEQAGGQMVQCCAGDCADGTKAKCVPRTGP